MTGVHLNFSASLSNTDPNQHPVCIIGQLPNLKLLSYSIIQAKLQPRVDEQTWNAALQSLHPSPTDSCSLWLTNASVAALPSKCSRHNAPSRAHSLTRIVKAYITGGEEYFVIVCERSDVFASGCAVARAFPLYTSKSNTKSQRKVTVEFLLVGTDTTPLDEEELRCLSDVSDGIRLAAKIVDMPCNLMHTDAFLEEIGRTGASLGIVPDIIRGDELVGRGFGGLVGVGRASVHPPALAVLSHKPEGATTTIAWVGKGIVFDTGGLSIKGKTAMPGMKRDCGGAAAILGAFQVAVKSGFAQNLHAVFCLAENSVGPESTRPDDVIVLYSGKSVEINNTDAEGRLVLGDGVAFASKDLKADIIVDMATLTGAQGIATGKYHGAIVTNRAEWEDLTVTAGRNSADLVHPMPYCPEFYFPEFASAVADMKNSVADRSNAQVSCAGIFIASHIEASGSGFDFPCTWLHIDMAAPVHCGERATGYGVALLTSLFGEYSCNPLLRSVAPSIDESCKQASNKKIRLV